MDCHNTGLRMNEIVFVLGFSDIFFFFFFFFEIVFSTIRIFWGPSRHRVIPSEIDNDAYCVCTHDFSPCTHRNIRPVRTMYAVKISGTQTVYDLMRTQIKIPFKLSQNDNLSTSIVRLLCHQSKSSYNMNAASDRFILHTMQYIMYLQ